MKTNILKWDIKFQTVFIAAYILSIALGLFITPGYWFFLLAFQLAGVTAQIIGSGMHLLLQHKSIGFANWRRIHFWGWISYLVLFYAYNLLFFDERPTTFNHIIIIIACFIIPQCVFYAYYFLCIKELHFLQNREFHILR